MRERHHRALLLILGGVDDLALVERLQHGRARGIEQVGVAVELGGVRHRLDVNRAALDRGEHHAVAAEARGKLGDERGRRIAEVVLPEERGSQLQHRVQAQPGRFHRIGVAAQQHFQPARAPLQLAHRGLQRDILAPRHVEADHAANLAVDAHRVGHQEIALFAGLEQPASFAQHALDELPELAALAPALGPEGERRESLDAGLLQHDQRVAHAADQAALQLEPGLAELLGCARGAEAAPRDVELAALGVSEVEARGVAHLGIRAHGT